MSSESVSDTRLDELIANAEKLLEIAKRYSVDSEGARNCHAMVQALTELKSRRVQQAEPPAGCAEMAREIADALMCEVVSDAYGNFSYTGDALPVIAAKLAPLFTLLAEENQ